MSDVFISYSRRDEALVRALCGALAEAGREPWVDWRDIPPSAEWMREIRVAIDAAHDFVFVLSPRSLESATCSEELAHAIGRGKRLIPVVVEEVSRDEVTAELEALQWIFCRSEAEVESAVEKLHAALETDLEWVRSHTRLLLRATDWEDHDAEESYLLRGADLEEAVAWLSGPRPGAGPAPADLHSRFVQASQKAQARELEAVRRRYERALGRRLATDAAGIASESPELLERAVLLAVESVRRFPTPEATEVLRDLLPLLPQRLASWSVSPWPNILEFSPSGELLLVAAGRPSPKEEAMGKNMEDYVDREDMERGLEYANSLEEEPEYGIARLFDAGTGREAARFEHERAVVEASFTPDGRGVVTKSGDTFRVWSIATGDQAAGGEELLASDYERARDRRQELAPRLEEALDGLSDADVVEQLRLLGETPRGVRRRKRSLQALADRLCDVAEGFTGDGLHWFELGKERVSMREVAGCREVARLPRDPNYGAFAVHPSLPRVAVAVGERVEVWEMTGGWTAVTFETEERVVRLRFNADSSCLGLERDGPGRVVDVWDLDALAVATDPDRIAEMESALEGSRKAWDAPPTRRSPGVEAVWEEHSTAVRVRLDDREAPVELEGSGTVDDVLLGPSGDLIAVLTGSGLRVWTLPDGELVGELDIEENTALRAAALSADGRWVAAGDYLGRVAVWRLSSGEELARFAHDGDVRDAVFSPDGEHLITASADRTARVWDLARRSAVGRLAHDGAVEAVTLSPDARLLATRTDTGVARVWRWDPGDLAALAAERVTRDLSREEWAQYAGDEPYPGSAEA